MRIETVDDAPYIVEGDEVTNAYQGHKRSIMEVLRDGKARTFTEILNKTGINKSSVQSALETLVDVRALVKHENYYSVK